MGGPAWLTDIFAGVMITVAAYCASRLVVARWWRRPTDVDSDGVHVVMGVAMAGMLVAGLRFGPAGLWEAVFAAAAGWFGWRFVRVRRGAPLSQWRCPQPVPHLVECGAMLYMYLAVPAVAVAAKGAAGGMGTMAADRGALLVPGPGARVVHARLRGVGRRPAHRAGSRAGRAAAGLARRLRRCQPRASVPGPPVRRAVQDRNGNHHGLHADPHALAMFPPLPGIPAVQDAFARLGAIPMSWSA